jgi:hypothetical protein
VADAAARSGKKQRAPRLIRGVGVRHDVDPRGSLRRFRPHYIGLRYVLAALGSE